MSDGADVEKIGEKFGALEPGPRGGMLHRGRPKGGKPGPGRPPSAVRAASRAGYDAAIPILQRLLRSKETRPADRIRAAEVLARYGGLTSLTADGDDGQPLPLPLTGADELAARILAAARSADAGPGAEGAPTA